MKSTETKIANKFITNLEDGMPVTEAAWATVCWVRESATDAGWSEAEVTNAAAHTAVIIAKWCAEALVDFSQTKV